MKPFLPTLRSCPTRGLSLGIAVLLALGTSLFQSITARAAETGSTNAPNPLLTVERIFKGGEFGGEAQLVVGNYGQIEANASLDFPLGEDFAGDAVRVTLLAPVAGLEEAAWCQAVPASDPRMDGFREALASGEPLCGRLPPERQALLFGDAAGRVASCAVLPVAGVGLVAVGSVDPNRFFPGMGTLFLRMMAEALATAMGRASPR